MQQVFHIAVQRIREFEKSKGWLKKRILIVGDREQTSHFMTISEDEIFNSEHDTITLQTIADKYENISLPHEHYFTDELITWKIRMQTLNMTLF